MLFLEQPESFSPKLEVAGCFVEAENKILLLHRQDTDKDDANTWCVPAGKIEKGETPLEAIQRELREETGISLPPEKFTLFKKTYLVRPSVHFLYYVFTVSLDQQPEVVIDAREHKAHAWVTPEEGLKMDLIPDEDMCIKMLIESKQMKK